MTSATARPERCSFLPCVRAGERRPKGSQRLSLPTRPAPRGFQSVCREKTPGWGRKESGPGKYKMLETLHAGQEGSGTSPQTHPVASVLPLGLSRMPQRSFHVASRIRLVGALPGSHGGLWSIYCYCYYFLFLSPLFKLRGIQVDRGGGPPARRRACVCP